MKKGIAIFLSGILLFIFSSCSSPGVPQEEYNSLQEEYNALLEENDSLSSRVKELQDELTELSMKYNELNNQSIDNQLNDVLPETIASSLQEQGKDVEYGIVGEKQVVFTYCIDSVTSETIKASFDTIMSELTLINYLYEEFEHELYTFIVTDSSNRVVFGITLTPYDPVVNNDVFLGTNYITDVSDALL